MIPFNDRLYLGFEAEFLVKSKLYGIGLDAFKPPGDFGYDLIVTDAILGKGSFPGTKFPYLLQVKSRRFGDEHIVQGPYSRPEIEIIFQIKRENLDQLKKNESAFLVLVGIPSRETKGILDSHFTVWLSSKHLNYLEERGYFIEADDGYTLKICYRSHSQKTRNELLNELEDAGLLHSGLETKLSRLLPERWNMSDKTKEYISLVRMSRQRDSNDEVRKMINNELLDVGKIGWNVSLGPDID